MSIVISRIKDPRKKKHHKCGGYSEHTPNGTEYDCSYQSSLTCEECKYGLGTKDPNAKCNKV